MDTLLTLAEGLASIAVLLLGMVVVLPWIAYAAGPLLLLPNPVTLLFRYWDWCEAKQKSWKDNAACARICGVGTNGHKRACPKNPDHRAS